MQNNTRVSNAQSSLSSGRSTKKKKPKMTSDVWDSFDQVCVAIKKVVE